MRALHGWLVFNCTATSPMQLFKTSAGLLFLSRICYYIAPRFFTISNINLQIGRISNEDLIVQVTNISVSIMLLQNLHCPNSVGVGGGYYCHGTCTFHKKRAFDHRMSRRNMQMFCAWA